MPVGSLADDLLILSLNGLSKTYRVAGFRTGWMVVSGAKHRAKDFIEGLEILASMRLCPNVPTQHAIQTALGGYQSMKELIRPGGRLYESRQVILDAVEDSKYLTLIAPTGSMYAFIGIDENVLPGIDDHEFALVDLVCHRS